MNDEFEERARLELKRDEWDDIAVTEPQGNIAWQRIAAALRAEHIRALEWVQEFVTHDLYLEERIAELKAQGAGSSGAPAQPE